MSQPFPLPVLGFVAYCSNSGKTTLLRRVISLLKQQGVRVGIVKHCHHEIQIDKPGKDSYELRKAGAEQAVLASANGWALMVEHEQPQYPELSYLLERMDTDQLDVVLLEGFRQSGLPKIEVSRNELNTPLMCQSPDGENTIIAVATDGIIADSPVPVLDLNNPAEVVEFIQKWIEQW